MGDTHIWKGAILMLHLHPPDARELSPCPLVNLQGVTRFRDILWRQSGTMGNQSCQLPLLEGTGLLIPFTNGETLQRRPKNSTPSDDVLENWHQL